jgi:ketosteroid isomerase-like protein
MSTLEAMVDSEGLQHAFDAAIAGDLDPLVELFSPDLHWSGLERGHLWWKKAPA